MTEPASSELWKGSIERPIQIGENRNASGSLLFHTLCHLSPRQLAALLVSRSRRATERAGRFFQHAVPAEPDCRWQPRSESLTPGSQNNAIGGLLAGNFRFLGRTEGVGWPPRWRVGTAGRLWEYNLHYFEYLWALEFDSAKAVVGDWIANYPLERRAVGWEPYPTSLRLMNWCAVFFARHAERTAADQAFRSDLWRSIYLQAEWLLRHVETHLMGNHLLENAVALAFCGSCFDGEAAGRWKRAGMDLLSEQLPEQIFADGCHFEQSPMYHLRAAYGLTSLLNTGDAELAGQVREPLERMMNALLRLCHPDGRIALLGDSAFSIYNQPSDLRDWWVSVAGDTRVDERVDPEVFALRDSGYYGARHPNGHYLICDAGPMGPDYQMGHAHGDLFSFELSLRGHRVICDSGVHGYDGDPYRSYCRSTRAHNTVEVDGEDQCEFWATFRVARRARPREVRWEATEDGFRLSGWHDGYERLSGKPRHYRQFNWHERGALIVKDRVSSARSVPVASRLHLHPDCEIVNLVSQTAQIRAPGGDFYVAFAGRGRLEVEKSAYCPEFGVAIENQALVFSSAGTDVEMGFCISDESLDDARTLSDSLFPS
jgi:uncharacterized heparinase superfamily protein